MKRVLLFGATLCMSLAAYGQPTDVERFLVPIYDNAFGAFGSQWVSELRIMNTGNAPAAIANLTDFSIVEPALPPLLLPGATMNGFAAILNVPGGTGIQGALLIVPKASANQFAFQLRVRDVSRDAERWGVAIPIVHESQASTQPLDLLAVPIDSRFRQMLRIYSFDRVAGSQVRVRIYGATAEALRVPSVSDPLLTDFVLPLTLAVSSSQPSYAELANLAGIDGVAGSAYKEIRVKVEPLQATRLWAMVSVTNNTTQEVTIISPNLN